MGKKKMKDAKMIFAWCVQIYTNFHDFLFRYGGLWPTSIGLLILRVVLFILHYQTCLKEFWTCLGAFKNNILHAYSQWCCATYWDDNDNELLLRMSHATYWDDHNNELLLMTETLILIIPIIFVIYSLM